MKWWSYDSQSEGDFHWVNDSLSQKILFTLSSLFVIESLVVAVLATRNHSRHLLNLQLQRACVRILFVGPVYVTFTWLDFMFPSYDNVIAIFVGMYEGYAMLSLFELFVIYIGGESKAVLALKSLAKRKTPSCLYYLTCEQFCGTKIGTLTLSCCELKSGQSLYYFLIGSVVQYSVVKLIINFVSLIIIAFLDPKLPRISCFVNMLRVFELISLIWAAQALTQMYHAVRPRLWGLGGAHIFKVMIFMISVIFITEVTSIILVVGATGKTFWSGNYISTYIMDFESVRVLTLLASLQFTIFTNIFYRIFSPDVLDKGVTSLWCQELRQDNISMCKFFQEVWTLHKIFEKGEKSISRNSSTRSVSMMDSNSERSGLLTAGENQNVTV